MTEVLRQRIEHLKLQGFSVRQISEMQNVDEREVRKLYTSIVNKSKSPVHKSKEIPHKLGNGVLLPKIIRIRWVYNGE